VRRGRGVVARAPGVRVRGGGRRRRAGRLGREAPVLLPGAGQAARSVARVQGHLPCTISLGQGRLQGVLTRGPGLRHLAGLLLRRRAASHAVRLTRLGALGSDRCAGGGGK
jgi:hypothetical protein